MVRIDVTPNVTFTGSSPSTRENVTTGGCLSARRAAMRILRCNCVDDSYRSGAADLLVPSRRSWRAQCPA